MTTNIKERYLNLKSDAFAVTPKPKKKWLELSSSKRLRIVSEKLQFMDEKIFSIIKILSANVEGHIIVKLLKELSPAERGTLLLDIEFYLKNNVDEALYLSVEPMGDKSSLRNLRGLTIKSE
ncbi:MAG: hypothetical protein CMM91_01595 [Rickettsiales bacterium]|nr:hypothetical protein [Rickettsiales bacterium]|tara:strand:- start:5197 stop:5562 length:366 start_codon:yes stop_codon:yes gene_type:complete